MPRYKIKYNIRYNNGTVKIEANSPEEAVSKFEVLDLEFLKDNTDDGSTEIECIEDDQGVIHSVC